MTVDDGTGLLVCIQWSTASSETPRTLPLGTLVTLQGRVQDFRGTRQVLLSRLMEETDPNAEWVRWLETLKYQALYATFSSPRHPDPSVSTPPPSLQEHIQALLRGDSSHLSLPEASLDAWTRTTPNKKESNHSSFQEAFDRALSETFMTESELSRLIHLWLLDSLTDPSLALPRITPSSPTTSRRSFTFADVVSDPQILALVHRVFECQVPPFSYSTTNSFVNIL
jgi:hypothetical protein